MDFASWLPLVLIIWPLGLFAALWWIERRRPMPHVTRDSSVNAGPWALVLGLGMVAAFVWLAAWVV